MNLWEEYKIDGMGLFLGLFLVANAAFLAGWGFGEWRFERRMIDAATTNAPAALKMKLVPVWSGKHLILIPFPEDKAPAP